MLFVVRAAAGAVAVDVPISAWLLGCTALLALFLALGKRRGELVLVETRATPGRPVLSMYSLGALDRLVLLVATATVVVYAAYTVSAHDARALPATIPFVTFGVFRYVYLLRRRGLGEEPDQVLVSDKPILVAVALWVASARPCWLSAERSSGALGCRVGSDLPHVATVRGAVGRGPLELVEPRVDAAPACRDEIDEHREVVDAGVALCEHVLFQPLESPDGVVEQSTDLGEALADDGDLASQALLDAPVTRSGSPVSSSTVAAVSASISNACPLERRVEPVGAAPLSGLFDVPLRPFQCIFVHGRQGYSGRRMRSAPSSTTSCRPS